MENRYYIYLEQEYALQTKAIVRILHTSLSRAYRNDIELRELCHYQARKYSKYPQSKIIGVMKFLMLHLELLTVPDTTPTPLP
jgi:hypothetical protein